MDFAWWELVLFGFIAAGTAVGLGVGFRKYKTVSTRKKGSSGFVGRS